MAPDRNYVSKPGFLSRHEENKGDQGGGEQEDLVLRVALVKIKGKRCVNERSSTLPIQQFNPNKEFC